MSIYLFQATFFLFMHLLSSQNYVNKRTVFFIATTLSFHKITKELIVTASKNIS